MSAGKTFVVRRGQTAIPNSTIYNTFQGVPGKDGEPGRLSIQALGVLLLMLSRPSGRASMGYRAFLGRGMGRDGLLKALRELEGAGLRHQFKRRGAKGSIITDTIVSETPITATEAEAEWLQEVRQELNGQPVDNPPSDRAPENGATGPEKASTVRRFTVARLGGASSVPEAKVSKETSSQETGDNQKAEPGEPSQGGAAVVNDATPGPGRAQARAMLEERRRLKAIKAQKESLRSSIDGEGVHTSRAGSPNESWECRCGWTIVWPKDNALQAAGAYDDIGDHQRDHDDLDAREAQP